MALDPVVALTVLVALVVLVLLVWTGRKRFPLRIGMGNFFRRKTQVAIVVAGLLVGTAIISSSYVIQSTFDFTIRSSVFHSLDYIDEVIYLPATDGSRLPFNASAFDSLHAALDNRSMPAVAGLAPRYQVTASAFDNNTQLLEPSAGLIGFSAAYDLGSFVRPDGSSWDGSGITATQVIVNQAFVNDTEAKVGDTLLVFAGSSGRPLPLTVDAVVLDSGRGAYNGNPNLFVPLATVQAALQQPGKINVITVANVGGPTQGYLKTGEVDAQLTPRLPAGVGLTISNVKSDQADQAGQNVQQLSQIFLLLGSFTIVAGVLLIINIFVMLAEERKGEMGVSRALGMRRSHLVQSFVAEGLAYALLSAAVGTLVGLLLAGVILWAFTLVFPARLFGGVTFILTWTPLDLIRGFAIGFLITMGTILLASWRVSKLNIVRAIRDIPEPVEHRSTRPQLALGVLLTLAGAFATFEAFRRQDVLYQDLGPSSLAIGLAILLRNVVSPRVAFSAAGIFLLVWLLYPYKPISPTGADISVFVAAGLLMIFGALLLVMFNSEVLLWFASRIGRGRTWRPVVRTAVAYPMNKKFRTGTTLATIALIMFTIATMSGIQTIVGTSITTTVIRQSGGYDLIAQTNPAIPKDNFWSLYNVSTLPQNVSEVHGLSWARIRTSFNASDGGALHNTSLLGVPSEWVAASIPLELQALDPNYTSAQQAWSALETDPHVAIADGSVVPGGAAAGFGGGGFFTYSAKVGDTLYFRNATGSPDHVRIIGILYEQFVPGLFVGWNVVASGFAVPLPGGLIHPVNYPSIFYVKVKAGVDTGAVAHEFERTFLPYQMIAFDLHSLISQITDVISGVFNLLEAYLALGLIVGIAGLGVITMRNVVERRTETGALRALGFRKSMILRSFLLELGFISGTGIVIGDVLGVALSYDIYLKFFADLGSYAVPWERILLLSVIAFIGAVVATASPAIRAARMPPAEALRSYE
ncbi:MAG TPA: FtsX-like permease family protein [Thermoplasmata archaeon]|nr:FtsX-like permease family protein [Thermoplasmata archaeon]